MAFLRRDLCREVTHADRCTLVFDTDSKRLYVELEVPHLDVTVGGSVDWQMATMVIANYLKQGRQTAGHHKLWQLLEMLFKEDRDGTESTDKTSSAVMTYNKLRI